jgi:hypothetical protein
VKRPEQNTHIAIVRALRLGLPKDWIVCHYPAGGLRTKREAALLKAMGVIPGIPDIIVFGPQGQCWFQEVKAPNGSLSLAQKAVLAQLNDLGHTFAVVRSLDEALAFGRVWGWPLRADIALKPPPKRLPAPLLMLPAPEAAE